MLLTVFVVGTLVALVMLMSASPNLGNDASLFAVFGREWLIEGKVPYRDLLDDKPPFIFLYDGLGALFGQWLGLGVEFGVRLSSALACGLAGALVTLLARRHRVRQSVALIFGVNAAYLLSAYQFAAGGGLSEPPALALILASWVVIGDGSKLHRALGAGMLAAAALGFSLFALPWLILPVAVVVGRAYQARSYRQAITALAAMTLGGLMILLPVMGYLALNGAFSQFLDAIFTYNLWHGSRNCGLTVAGFFCFGGSWLTLLLWFGPPVPLLVIAIAGLRHSLSLALLALLLAGSAASLVGLRASPTGQYWWSLYVALLIPAAIGLEALVARYEQHVARHAGALVTTILALCPLLLVFVVGGLMQIKAAPIYMYWDTEPEIAALIKQQPRAPLWLWSNATGLYQMADRSIAARYPNAWGMGLPGFTNAQRVYEQCAALVTTRAIAVIDTRGVPDLSGGQPLGPGLERAWYAPLVRVLARDWVTIGGNRAMNVLVIRDNAAPTLADCVK